MMILAKQTGSDENHKYKIIASIPFEMIFVNSIFDAIGAENQIEIVHIGSAKFILCTDSAYSKNIWVKAFKKATDMWLKNTNASRQVMCDRKSVVVEQHHQSHETDVESQATEASPSSITTILTTTQMEATPISTAIDLSIANTSETTLIAQCCGEEDIAIKDPVKVGPNTHEAGKGRLTESKINIDEKDLQKTTAVINKEVELLFTDDAGRHGNKGQSLDMLKMTSTSNIVNRATQPSEKLTSDIDLLCLKERRTRSVCNIEAAQPIAVKLQSSPLKRTAVTSNPFIVQDAQHKTVPAFPYSRTSTHGRAQSARPVALLVKNIEQQKLSAFPISPSNDMKNDLESKIEHFNSLQKTAIHVLKSPIKHVIPNKVTSPGVDKASYSKEISQELQSLRSGLNKTGKGVVITGTDSENLKPSNFRNTYQNNTNSSTKSNEFLNKLRAGNDLGSVPEDAQTDNAKKQGGAFNVNRPVKSVIICEVSKHTGKAGKDYVYSLKVLHMSGETKASTIYHTYEDFFDFHLKLLGHFPEEAGLSVGGSTLKQNSKGEIIIPSRIIPDLPGQMMYVSDALATSRIGLLQEYLKEILCLPAKIVRSPVAMSFFRDNGKKAQSLL